MNQSKRQRRAARKAKANGQPTPAEFSWPLREARFLARRRLVIKRQLRRAGIAIPAAILLDTRALRALRAAS